MSKKFKIKHSDQMAEKGECECDECLQMQSEIENESTEESDESEGGLCPSCLSREESAIHSHMMTLTTALGALRDTAIGLKSSALSRDQTWKIQSEAIISKCLRGMDVLSNAIGSWSRQTLEDDDEDEKESEKKLPQ